MPLLNPILSTPDGFQNILKAFQKRTEVDLAEVERVIELARRTPGLSQYEDELRRLSVFFSVATVEYREYEPEGLEGLVEFWERYRAAVVQRYSGVTPVVLGAADRIVQNVFDRFVTKVPNENILYDKDAKPLVYGGEGGLGAYFTHPPGWSRPFAIINLPHAAFDHAWQWLALPHEVGHDMYAAVLGLPTELEDTLENRMRQAVANNEVDVPDVHRNMNEFGVDYTIQYSGEDFLAKAWRGWTNEAQADMVALLNCGGAAAVSLQQIVEFSNEDEWYLAKDEEGEIVDFTEEHPTAYVRAALAIEALRLLDAGSHAALADEIEARFQALRPEGEKITWYLGNVDFPVTVAEVDATEMLKSAKIAANTLLNHTLAALGDKTYSELGTFTGEDQDAVNQLAEGLVGGEADFADGISPAEPRHKLAATMFALEKDPAAADAINHTFQHFS